MIHGKNGSYGGKWRSPHRGNGLAMIATSESSCTTLAPVCSEVRRSRGEIEEEIEGEIKGEIEGGIKGEIEVGRVHVSHFKFHFKRALGDSGEDSCGDGGDACGDD